MRWPVVRSCRDTVERTTRLAAAAGITRQHQLLGTHASRARIGHALREAAAGLDPHGHLLVAFTGHSDREPADPDEPPGIGWCVHDGTLPLVEVAALLSVVPPTALITVIADTCYAAALSGFTIPATVVLLAACGANQQVLANPAEGFVARLEQLVLPGGQPNPRCTSYRWLNRQPRQDTPDMERLSVWTNRLSAWSRGPFRQPCSPHRLAVREVNSAAQSQRNGGPARHVPADRGDRRRGDGKSLRLPLAATRHRPPHQARRKRACRVLTRPSAASPRPCGIMAALGLVAPITRRYTRSSSGPRQLHHERIIDL